MYFRDRGVTYTLRGARGRVAVGTLARRVSLASGGRWTVALDFVGAREGGFTAIKLEVAGGNLEMYNIKVTFGNGQSFSPETRIQFHQGSWSRTIDLPGPVRILRRVDFWYRSRLRPARGAATMRLFGRK